MDQSHSVTHRDEKSWRILVTMFGASVFGILSSPLILEAVPFDALTLAMLTMTVLGIVISALTYNVWRHWKSVLLTLAAANLAVFAGWVYVKGVPGAPPMLWPLFGTVLAFVAGAFAILSGFLRVIKTVEPGYYFAGEWKRMCWECLLPCSLFGGAVLALSGDYRDGILFVLAFVAVQMFWTPGWNTSRTANTL